MPEINQLIAQHGLVLVFANVLVERIGVPIPALPTLVIAGALAADGRLPATALLGVALLACVIGDTAWFTAGRTYGNRVMKLLCRVSLSPDSCVRQTESQFERWGGMSLVLSKFIPGLATVAAPLAGAMRLGWPSFLFWNGLGTVFWAGAAVGVGMVFHEQIGDLIDRIEDLGGAAAALAGALLAGYIALKWWERRRFYKTLRLARISVDGLRQLLQKKMGAVVVDVRSSVVRNSDPRFIPGAIALDLEDLDKRIAELSPDREIVFYCSCPNEASAAAVAKRLIDRGYVRVRPLLGGLDAWIAAGYDVESRR